MKFLHVLLRKFGTFSARTPTYYVVNFLHNRGHQNLILNQDYMVESDKKMFSYIGKVGRNIYENIFVTTKALASLDYDVVIIYDTYEAVCSLPFSLFKFLISSIKKKSRKMKIMLYYNLELFVLDYKSYLKSRIGWLLEQLFILGCDAFVSLSPLRLSIAQKIFNIPCHKFIVPNSPDFEGENVRMVPNKPLKLLYTGGVEEYVFSGIEKLRKNQKFKFIIHGASKYGIDAFLMNKLKDKDYVELHTGVIAEYEKFKRYVAEYDAGFIWYNAERLNDRFAGWSSGKYFRYLSMGKPVIVRNLPELTETTINNGFGVVIDEFEQIPEAVDRINDNYSLFVSNILKNYHKFAFSPNFSKVYNFVLSKIQSS